ncbi:nudC domain-containing protein 1 [Anopheles maculipalpis]|uniref:nudC domain-containing protein 1 n=1 Tax=Anopheles maculipalpis TaxID=1496333 RepID=UPI00215982C7|nr:nudC domain-containing protein 1 [Anopheles maculipalpis]
MPHIELVPDRKLLKTNFDGYILSLEPVPMLTVDFSATNCPHRLKPNEQQYSYYHARLFGMQNHLVRDPWATGVCYYIDVTGMVQRVYYDNTLGRIRPLVAVFKLPFPTVDLAPDDDRYNCSLVFPSEQLCLLSDGCGTVRVLETGDRTAGREWKQQSAIRPRECELAEGMLPGGSILLDGRFLVQDGKRLLHFVLLQVEHNAMEKSKSLLHWITLEQQSTGSTWTLTVSRTLESAGYPRYCVLDYHATGVLVACDEPFRFRHDSNKPILPPEPEPVSVDPTEKPAWERFPFRWTQTLDEISVTFDKHPTVLYRVVTESPGGESDLKVFANDVLLIDGTQLYATIDHEQTVWAMDRNILEITLHKQATGALWPFLFPGGPDETGAPGEPDNPSPATDLPPATNLNAPLEACDFEGEQDTYYTLERLSCANHEVTHTVSLGSGPPLFTVALRAGLPASFALRHDVDACLWQLQPVPFGSDSYRFQHEGTLHAFGYVQASKRQQKYLNCPPGMEYAAICESHRSLYIYKANYGGAGLRNRTGPQVAIGQYQFVSLKDTGEVLGISCEDDVLMLLTEKALLALQITSA